jgi:hypothetical protein
MSERKKRKNITIMFRVPEPTTNVKLDRINADLRVVKEIGAHIDINIKAPLLLFLLSPLVSCRDPPRLLLIHL